jgi:hypothetical protein
MIKMDGVTAQSEEESVLGRESSLELCPAKPVDLSNNNNNNSKSGNNNNPALSFSVENILDPTKFTGKQCASLAGAKNPFPADFPSTPSSNFRFSFKDIHGE